MAAGTESDMPGLVAAEVDARGAFEDGMGVADQVGDEGCCGRLAWTERIDIAGGFRQPAERRVGNEHMLHVPERLEEGIDEETETAPVPDQVAPLIGRKRIGSGELWM